MVIQYETRKKYTVQYGEVDVNEHDRVYEAGDVVLLKPQNADFLDDQVKYTPDAFLPSVDVSSIAGSYGHELLGQSHIDTGQIKQGVGGTDGKDTINVEEIADKYGRQTNQNQQNQQTQP